MLRANGRVSDWDRLLRWKANISALKISGDGIGEVSRNLGKRISILKEVLRLGDIYYIGEVYGAGKKAGTRGQLKTGVGEVAIKAEKLAPSSRLASTPRASTWAESSTTGSSASWQHRFRLTATSNISMPRAAFRASISTSTATATYR